MRLKNPPLMATSALADRDSSGRKLSPCWRSSCARGWSLRPSALSLPPTRKIRSGLTPTLMVRSSITRPFCMNGASAGLLIGSFPRGCMATVLPPTPSSTSRHGVAKLKLRRRMAWPRSFKSRPSWRGCKSSCLRILRCREVVCKAKAKSVPMRCANVGPLISSTRRFAVAPLPRLKP